MDPQRLGTSTAAYDGNPQGEMHRPHATQMQPRCNPDATQMQPRCNPDATQMERCAHR
ncbi:hypothetical protein ABBQ38_009503 [Trebouxia sp. C0009 RCD-2024]